MAIYVAGVSVECLLRAFKGRDSTFDERHDLLRLFAASGILHIHHDRLRSKGWDEIRISEHLRGLQVSVNEIYRLWGNDYRFACEDRLRLHLKQKTRDRKIKGDYLKEQARRFLSSAQQIINKGAVLWRA